VRDRIDLVVSVPRQSYDVLFADGAAEEGSAPVRARVTSARQQQAARNRELMQRERSRRRRRRDRPEPPRPGVAPAGADALPAWNAHLEGIPLLSACDPTPAATRMLSVAGERLHLSARAFHRVLRVARTIADLAGEERVDEGPLAEALRLRGEVGR
jgi:magnesium chelatase family protein